MIVKIKQDEFDSGLDDLAAALTEVVEGAQLVISLIQEVRDEKEIRGDEYEMLLKLSRANCDSRFVSLTLLKELFPDAPELK